MLGVLLTLVIAKGWTGIGWPIVKRLQPVTDPALRFGLSGLIGLGSLGMLTFFLGLIPGGFSFGIYVVALLTVIGYLLLWKGFRSDLQGRMPQLPKGGWLMVPLVLTVASLMALVSVLTPPDANEWDSLAYHLAAPKQWIEAGQITFIPTMHQSNFPFVVDNLYVWGLQYGGTSGARAFQLCFFLLGLVSIFGFTRQRFGNGPARWATLAFGTVPVALWEAGTGYIDLAHGLFAGLGILLAAQIFSPAPLEASEPPAPDGKAVWLAAILLGFGAASKYTGLQTIFAVAVILVIWAVLQKRAGDGLKYAALIGVVGILFASPWLIRNVVNVGNPTYPFFYEVFGGKNWDARHSAIYKNEQQSFGLARTESGGRDPLGIGEGILGLAFVPGRYVNPAQTIGLGSPLGALGFVVIAVFMLWAISGRAGPFERQTLAVVLISALIWFFFSQQSRYIITWAIPLSVLAGAATVRLRAGRAIAVSIGVQAAVTLFIMNALHTGQQLPVAIGDRSPTDYQESTVPFAKAAKDINERAKGGKVALYDEVFGFLLDVPYVWANPGHSTLIDYDHLNTGQEYAEAMKALGFTDIYINLNPLVKDREFARRWVGTMGLNGAPVPFSDDERKRLLDDWQTKWTVLLADAVRDHALVPVTSYRDGILFEIPKQPK